MRRRFKSNAEFQLTKTTGDIARNRRFQKPSETRKSKRVRFDDAQTDASSGGHEANQSPKCGAPKTSEYAYFRKVKDGARNDHLRAVQNENKQLKSSKIDRLFTETCKPSEELDPRTEGLNFNISGESAGPSEHNHFVSPPVVKYDKSYEIRRKGLTHKNKTKSPLLTETVTPVGQSLFSSLLNHATEKSENQCTEKNIFSEKRKRLCQWIAHSTSSGVEKLHGEGSDLVSLLMSRLIPKQNENDDSSKGDADDISKSLIIHESDPLERDLPLSHKIDCDKYLSKLRSERTSEVTLREWKSFDPGIPPNYHNEGDHPLSHKIDFHMDLSNFCAERSCEITARDWQSLGSGIPPNYRKEGDHPLSHKIDFHMDLSKFCAERSSEITARDWESFDSGFPWDNHKGSDLQNKTRDHPSRASEIVLSGWEKFNSRFPYDYRKEGVLQNTTMDTDLHSNSCICNSSVTHHGFSFCLPHESFRPLGAFHFKDLSSFDPIIRHGREEPYRQWLEWDLEFGKDRVDHGIRKNVHRIGNAWDADQQIVVDNMLKIKGLSPAPLFPSRCLFKPLPDYVPTGYLMHEVGSNLDDMEYAMVEPGHFSLTVPSSPKCIPWEADENLSNSNILFSHRDPRLPKTVWDSTPQIDFRLKCLPASEFSAEDHPSRFHSWQFPQNESGSCSFSLLKEAPGESGNTFYGSALNHYLLPSALHSPLDAYMNCPLLLNHVSHDQELYSDDYDSQLGYRK